MKNTVKDKSDIVKKLTQENKTLKSENSKLKRKLLKFDAAVLTLQKLVLTPKPKNSSIKSIHNTSKVKSDKDKVDIHESYPERIARLQARAKHNDPPRS